MNNPHTKEEIAALLKKQQVAVIATNDNPSDSIRLRIMYYGIGSNFECYLMTLKDSPKLAHITDSSRVTMLFYNLESPFENTWEAEMNGSAEILFKLEEIKTALEELKGRNPFADVALEAGLTAGHFAFLKFKPETLRFRIYSESLHNVPPTVLEFK